MTSELGQLLTLSAYYAVLFLLALYGAHRAYMVHLYFRHRRETPRPSGTLAELPRVTVQLPIYNESTSSSGSSTSVAALDYPRDLLEIQVLDDSTDETREIARATVGAAAGARAATSTTCTAEHRARLQGRRARERSRHAPRANSSPSSTPTSSRSPISSARPFPTSPIPASAWSRRAGSTSTASTRC